MMVRRTVFIGVFAVALAIVCVAVGLAQDAGNGNSKVAVLAGWELVQSAEFVPRAQLFCRARRRMPEGQSAARWRILQESVDARQPARV